MRWAALALLAASVFRSAAASARPALVMRGGIASGGSAISLSYAVPTGLDRFLLVGLSTAGGGAAIASVTYGGASLSRLVSESTPADSCRVELWGLSTPPVGAHALIVTPTAAKPFEAMALSYVGVDLLVYSSSWNWATAASDTPSVTLTAGPDDLVVDALCVGGAPRMSSSPASGQLLLWGLITGHNLGSGSQRQAAGGPTTMSWSVVKDAGTFWAQAALSLRSSSAPVPDAGSRDARPDGRPDPDAAPVVASSPDAPADVVAAPVDVTGDVVARPPDSAVSAGGRVDSPDASLDAPVMEADVRAVNVDLRVGCACEVGGRASNRGASMLAVLLLMIVRRRLQVPWKGEGLNISPRHLRSWQGARRANTERI